MRDAQKPDHVSLATLTNRLREGRFVIPDFQRDFEWRPADIRDLIRSIFLDYYIGSLLLWKGKSENLSALSCEPIYGYTTSGSSSPDHIVLDGQQRLTALYYTFLAPDVPLPNRANRYLYFVRVDQFMAEEYDAAFEYDWSRRGQKLLADRKAQFAQHMFPLAVMGESGWALPNWVQDYESYWIAQQSALEEAGDVDGQADAALHATNARLFGEHLKDLTEQYQIAYIELDKELELDKVCDIFTQINSRGIRLDAFDLINALLKPRGLQLKHMWREAESRLSFVESERMNVYILQVMSILKQAYCSPKYLYYLLPGQEKTVRGEGGHLRKEVLIADADEFRELWQRAVASLERSISMLRHPQEFGAISSNYLPYVSILPAFASLQEAVKVLEPSRKLDAQRKLRHWYWASVFTNRYSGSVESTAARDYLDVRAWFDDGPEPGVIADFKRGFQSLDLRRETKRGTSVYNGIFNLLVLRGARDWMSGTVPQHGDLDDHHIVPKAWEKDRSLESSIDSILNRTPMTAETNRNVIRDRLPNAYIPELIASNGEAQVRATLESHFISPRAFDILMRDPFMPEDYELFINERQRTLLDAIEDLLVKERLDLEPQLRDLDADVEVIELALRDRLAQELEDDAGRLPPHVLAKIEERLRLAARKNPRLDDDWYSTLGGKLEFADLRELQDTITSRSEWANFEPMFGSKGSLETRFNQLAELRNGIRHSRTVDQVTRMDGEAAIVWFRGCLGLPAT